jgi:hypothetical protein
MVTCTNVGCRVCDRSGCYLTPAPDTPKLMGALVPSTDMTPHGVASTPVGDPTMIGTPMGEELLGPMEGPMGWPGIAPAAAPAGEGPTGGLSGGLSGGGGVQVRSQTTSQSAPSAPGPFPDTASGATDADSGHRRSGAE